MGAHRFQIGQTVRFARAALPGQTAAPAGFFRVTRQLPAYEGSPQYRLESVSDGHERVAIEAELDEIRGP